MVCIYCENKTEVSNSRAKAHTPSVWRRRTCKKCVAQFTTTELPDYTKALLVETYGSKKHMPFSRDKLFLSLHKSLGHRGDALNSSTALVNTVIGRLLNKKYVVNGSVTTKIISKVAYEVLKRYDPLAATTYKAYHQAALKG